MAGNFVCTLCLDFSSEDPAKDYFVTTECGHLFHYFCLNPAYENGHNKCPNCREKINPHNWRKLYGVQPDEKPKAFKNFRGNAVRPAGSMGEELDYDYRFKIIVVGDSSVGKSCLMQRFVDEKFSVNVFSTIACDWRSKIIEVGNKKLSLSIWDTAGQERHRSLVTNYARDTHGALLVYDITEESTFEDIDMWDRFVTDNGLQGMAKVLVGNKTDLSDNRTVAKDRGKAKARKMGIPFFEASAKDAYNVEAAFRTLAAKILETDSLISLIEEKRQNPNVYLRGSDQASPGSLYTACSQSLHYMRMGLHGTMNGLKAGWRAVTPSSSSSSRSRRQT